jgi:hypothetical protein
MAADRLVELVIDRSRFEQAFRGSERPLHGPKLFVCEQTSGLFDGFVSDCPLAYASPNAPKTRDLLGTTMM